MNVACSKTFQHWPWKIGFGICFSMMLLVFAPRAEAVPFTNWLARGDEFAACSNVPAAMETYSHAEIVAATNSAELCVLTKHFCDLMYATSSPAVQKMLATRALSSAQQAVRADPQNATAHICVAVAYAKNFPFADNRAKVNFSRGIKTEAEAAIALDPKQDVAYYLLGRWHFGVANMNFLYRGLVKIVYGGLPAASDEQAIKNFKQAIALNPRRIIHHAELGKVYAATHQPELARAQWEICRTLKPLDRDDQAAQQSAAQELAQLTP